MQTLTKVEKTRLEQLEARIERGLIYAEETFLALLEIRDKQLYREKYATFEEYCRERWNKSRRHINRLIHWVSVNENLGPRGPILEKQARPLKGLSAEEQCEVVDEAQREAEADGGGVTASRIEQIAAKLKNRVRDEGIPAAKAMQDYSPAVQKQVVEHEQRQVRERTRRNGQREAAQAALRKGFQMKKILGCLDSDYQDRIFSKLDAAIDEIETVKAELA